MKYHQEGVQLDGGQQAVRQVSWKGATPASMEGLSAPVLWSNGPRNKPAQR